LKALVCGLFLGLIAASALAQPVPRWMTLPPAVAMAAARATANPMAMR